VNDATNTPPPGPSPLFSPARWQQMRALLDTLVDASAEAREAELVRIAANDAELASSLRELLAGTRDAATRHHSPLAEHLLPSASEEMPARVGPFRLIARIGTGGMGTVYLAEREHADFVQRVALKLLDGGSARLAQLASRERRILAALTHPNITAFVDAGNEDGRAWMAMEYVQGETLIEHCLQRDLDARARVRLFDQVCAAVAHAHAQLVVHRDLKPSNVLVDAEGRAKLLDFGIALVLNDGEAAAPATRVFTLEYAAPEQLRGERVTTASDVYSLGLILYELVTGKRLSTLDRSARDSEWTTAELARFATASDKAGNSAALMQRDAKALSQLLRGDLGRIIAHALNPLPAQRYASVASLREDLARWLDYRPLTISRPDPLYVLRRFVRRNRAGVAAAVLGLVAIIGLAATALWQARAKTQEAAVARAALRQSEATRDFMNSVFLSADPLKGKGTETTAGELLMAARSRIDKELAGEPEVAALMLHQIGNVYMSLGDGDAVKETLVKALEYNARSKHPSAILEGGDKARLAYVAHSTDRAKETLQELDAAVALLRAAGPDAHAELGTALRIYSNVRYSSGQDGPSEALKIVAESVELLGKLDDAHAFEYLLSVQELANMLATLERYDEALVVADRGLAHPIAQATEHATIRSQLLGVRAGALTGLKRFAEAEPALAQAIAVTSSAFGPEHGETRHWRFTRASLLENMGRLDEATSEIRSLLTVTSSSDDNQMAHIAQLSAAARLSSKRRDAHAAEEVAKAHAVMCGDQGTAAFCAWARLQGAEVAIREHRDALARAALEDCAKDEVIAKTPSFARRLKLLRARMARSTGQFDVARVLLDEAQGDAAVSPDETALIDIEGGYLAVAVGDRPAAVAALTRGRAHIARPLTELTPQVREIDAALEAAKATP
jgi:eukaryotic-like serine/threonine-protein kinase